MAENPGVLTQPGPRGPSLIRQALYRGRRDLADSLIEFGAVPDFFDACAFGDRKLARTFLAGDKSLAASFSDDGFPAIGLAIYFGHTDLAIDLLALGAPANEPSRNAFAVTPLHSATARKDYQMCAILLSHGADPNAGESAGGTPLHTAAALGDLETAKLLIRHGARLDAQTASGETPLDSARKHSRDEILEALQ